MYITEVMVTRCFHLAGTPHLGHLIFKDTRVRAASHVHLVVAELCCGMPCQLPAERWELAGKTQRQSSIKSSTIANSCQSLKKVM